MDVATVSRQASRDRIADYLNDLALEPRKIAAFRRDPDGALAESPLAPEERAVVRSADPAQLFHAIDSTVPHAAAVCVVICVVNTQCG